MDIMSSELTERIRQIKEFSKNNSISYYTMLDILEDKNPPLSKEIITQIMEELAADGISIISEDSTSEQETLNDESEKFVPASVRVEQRTLVISNLIERLRYGEINLQTGFQRHRNLWTPEQQSRLIESLMLKIPLPAFYFDASQGEHWKIIDGLQRLSAIQRFLVGTPNDCASDKKEETAKFCGFQYLREFNGLTFSELPRQYIRRVRESQIIAYTVEKGTPDAVVFNIFQRINTGGLKLEPQEIRHALYQGNATKLTEELAQSDEFIRATNGAVSPERMQDQEFINRFIAFTELDYKEKYNDDINSFLNKSLKVVNTYSEKDIDRIRCQFKRIMTICANLFGKYAFRKYNASWRRSPINKSMFELWSICFKDLPDSDAQYLIANQDKFLHEFQELQQKADFKASFDSTKSTAINKRIQLVNKFLGEFLCYNQ